jgi:transposase-like protein
MSAHTRFRWRHFQANIILCALCAMRRYARDALRHRDVEERMRERSVWVDHTTR